MLVFLNVCNVQSDMPKCVKFERYTDIQGVAVED